MLSAMRIIWLPFAFQLTCSTIFYSSNPFFLSGFLASYFNSYTHLNLFNTSNSPITIRGFHMVPFNPNFHITNMTYWWKTKQSFVAIRSVYFHLGGVKVYFNSFPIPTVITRFYVIFQLSCIFEMMEPIRFTNKTFK